MSEFEVITEPEIIKYPNGRIWTMNYKCDICGTDNLPMVSWPIDDDPFIHAMACQGCIDRISRTILGIPVEIPEKHVTLIKIVAYKIKMWWRNMPL